jgi:hypothetical protein
MQVGLLFWWKMKRRISSTGLGSVQERWAWLQRVIANRTFYPMTLYDWAKIELALKQELSSALKLLPISLERDRHDIAY